MESKSIVGWSGVHGDEGVINPAQYLCLKKCGIAVKTIRISGKVLHME